jgi:hypothetical protein
MRTKLIAVCALAAFVAAAGGTAEATGLIHTSGIAKGAVTFNRLSPGVQKMVSKKADQGENGTAGHDGANGHNGGDGAAGPQGPAGAKGDTGAKGAAGATGTQGAVGATGPQGPVGANGTTGATGLKGDAGTTGATGATGLKGATGATGATGANGLKGDTGANGAPGAKGDNGLKGDTGDKGDAGAPGAAGANANYVVVTHVTGGDSNVCGPDWANDSYTRTLQFIMRADGTIDVLRTYKGTFTTIAGASRPNDHSCNSVQVGGKVGTFTGTDVVTVTGGHFYPDATCADNCTSDAMLAAFFHGGTPVATRAVNHGWEYHYDLGAETMIQADAASRGGNEGDITAG